MDLIEFSHWFDAPLYVKTMLQKGICGISKAIQYKSAVAYLQSFTLSV
jgi:hypothetical protein